MTRPATPDAGWPTTGPSLQRRVGRFTLLAVLLAVLVTGLGGYLATRAATFRAVDTLLLPATDKARAELGVDPDDGAVGRFVSSSADLGVVVTAVVAADGRRYSGAGADVLPMDADYVSVAQGADPVDKTVRSTDGNAYRVRVVHVASGSGYALVVGRTMAATEQILRALAVALVAFGVTAVAAAGLVARRFARAGVAPVGALTADIELRAAAEDLTPVRVARNDEIGRLSVAFNHLLESITVARVRQARFVADAGHELRTPLTSMRTNVELLLADTQRTMLPPEDRLTVMRDVQAQLVQFSSLVTDLIGLTRKDRTAAELEEVDLAAVLDEAVDRASMRASGLTWQVDLEPTTVRGDVDLLARALGNVLDNAVTYSPLGGTVTVTLQGGEVRIGDEGRGVEPQERPFVFDRFYRSETARATPGTGLGLSITESVVRQHGGTVSVTDASGGGALFVVSLPTTTAGAAPDRLGATTPR